MFRSEVHREPVSDLTGPAAGSLLAVVTDLPRLQASAPVFHLDDAALATKLGELIERTLLDGP